jgi:PHD/YefM family antitoxin component YafN of YafNO toxin-antitoxin module
MPRLRLRLVAPVTAQLSVELWPLVMVDGVAVNEVITGAVAPELLELELLEEDELELLELEEEEELELLDDELDELLELEEELEFGVVTLTAADWALSLLAAS